MSEARGGTSCSAYAMSKNARLGGSRFVRRVEIRGSEGTVWLRGRRVPAWRIYLRPLGWIWSVIWRLVGLVLAAVLNTPELVSHSSQTDDLGDLWASEAKGVETVSWRAGDAGPPACSRSGKTRKAETAPGDCVVRIDVPIGREGRMKHLTLAIAADRSETLMQVLLGTAWRAAPVPHLLSGDIRP